MPVLDNPRHERFAQEIAKGCSATEAYALAGYKPNQPNAARLISNDMVKARVAELQEAGAKRAEVTIESLIDEAADIQTKAVQAGQHSAAVAALTAKAKLAGKWIDRNQHTGPNGGPIQHVDLSQLDDDKFRQLETILGPIANNRGDTGGA